MGMALWILFCLFSSIGLVQCAFWVLEALKKPEKICRGYHVIPLCNDPEKIEAQIRFGLARIRLSGLDGESVLLVDMGICEECREICAKLTNGICGVYICEADKLCETIAGLNSEACI